MRAYLDGCVRLCWYLSIIWLLTICFAPPSRAATLASKGVLNVPSDTRVMVISTDPVLQQVLSEDFGVARRRKPAGGPKMLTLTVSLIQRVLQPGLSMIDLAPGVPGVGALVKAAGYQPPSEGTNDPLTGDAAEYVQQGNPSAAAYNNNAYQRNPLQPNPVANQLDRLSAYAPGPPTAPDPRDPRYRPVAPPDYLQPQPAQVYDTAVIAHAVLSDGQGEMTAVAVAHPAEDIHAVKKQLAERIANAVLH
jgi:hypothetical protein